jgi:NAD-dependent deacetylase
MSDISRAVLLAARKLLENQPAAAFSGAGISAESGIPTFRGDDGIWKEYSPALYGNLPGLALAFIFRPQKLARFFLGVLNTFLDAEPNPGHEALGELSRKGLLGPVITQNIDNLHQRGGSPAVIEIHGSLTRWRCLRCGRRITLSREEFQGLREILSRPDTARMALIRLGQSRLPRCPQCRGRMRPDVVFFGEGLPRAEYNRAVDASMRCKLMLVLGTSGVVYPAASIPSIAKRGGAFIIEINPEPTAITRIADMFLPGPCGQVLPQLVKAVARLEDRP